MKEVNQVHARAHLLPRLLVIGTGGTMACVGAHRLDFTSYGETGKRLAIREVVDLVPEACELARVGAEEFANSGSVDFTPEQWASLAELVNSRLESDQGLSGIVITHGTASLEETAYLLHLTVKSERPVVLTGAVRPPTALSSDAPLNMLDAIRVAAHPASRGKGVLVVTNRQIASARESLKRRSGTPDAFRPDEIGLLGFVQPNGDVLYYRAPTRRHTFDSEFSQLHVRDLPRVDILFPYPGCDGAFVEAAVQNGAQGIVVVTLGSGGVPQAMYRALRDAIHKGVAVVLSSRVSEGAVPLSSDKRDDGFVSGDNLAPQKARILLMLALCATRNPEEIQRMFRQY